MNCNNCGNTIQPNETFCGNCGTPQQQMQQQPMMQQPMMNQQQPMQQQPMMGMQQPHMGMQPQKNNKNMIVIAVIVGLLALAAVVYFVFLNNDDDSGSSNRNRDRDNSESSEKDNDRDNDRDTGNALVCSGDEMGFPTKYEIYFGPNGPTRSYQELEITEIMRDAGISIDEAEELLCDELAANGVSCKIVQRSGKIFIAVEVDFSRISDRDLHNYFEDHNGSSAKKWDRSDFEEIFRDADFVCR